MESHGVKKEPEDETLLASLRLVKNNGDVKNNSNIAKSDEFSVPPIVKVEHGQGVEVTNYSTWTQDNYLDYYGYADEETGLFPFKPGEVDRQVDVHFTKPQEISELFDMTKQVVKEEPDATYPDEAFHKFPNQIMSHSTLGPDVANANEKLEDSEDLSDEKDDHVFESKSNLKENEAENKKPAPFEEKGSEPEGTQTQILHTTSSFPFEPGNTDGDATYNDENYTETVKNETHPFDPGVFDIEDSVDDESSGSRSIIDDPLFQHVAPSVVLCLHVLHDCRIILRCLAISLRQLHLHAVNLASSYDVTDSIKPFHIPEVNAEAWNDEELSIQKKE